MKICLYLCFFCAAFFLSYAAYAQQENLTPGNEPLEITADKSLEWKRSEKQFIATKNALAVQGDVSVAADILTAHYREGEKSGMEIWQVEAFGNVVIISRDNDATGEQAVYDLDKGLAVMTGNNLRMTSPDQVITARERFEYWVTEGRLVAVGDAKIVRTNAQGKTDTLRASEIAAVLKDNEKGERVLDTMEATGNVIIQTATETVTGAYGIYHADTNKAELTGGVTIRRGPNILEGEKAIVDLNTETSELFGGGADGRVRGVFYPGSEKKLEDGPATP